MHMTQAESAILVAEDNEDIRELVAHQLRRMGIHVLQADNGRKAMELALAEQPTLVLMDMDVPVMSGFDDGGAVTPRGLAQRIYGLTGHPATARKQNVHSRAGYDGLLGEPICSDVLRAQVPKVSG